MLGILPQLYPRLSSRLSPLQRIPSKLTAKGQSFSLGPDQGSAALPLTEPFKTDGQRPGTIFETLSRAVALAKLQAQPPSSESLQSRRPSAGASALLGPAQGSAALPSASSFKTGGQKATGYFRKSFQAVCSLGLAQGSAALQRTPTAKGQSLGTAQASAALPSASSFETEGQRPGAIFKNISRAVALALT
jgi:hypothetical protein